MEIEINILDERLFTDVALIIDRDDFLAEIKRLRMVFETKLKINASPEEVLIQNKFIEGEIEKSRKILYLPVTFRKVLEAITFNNKISEGDYKPAYLDSTWDTFNDVTHTIDETFFIVLSPGVRDKDVINALQEYRDRLGNEKLAPEYKMIPDTWDINKGKPSVRLHRKWYFQNLAGEAPEGIAQQEQDNCPAKIHRSKKNRVKDCTCFDVSTIRKAIDDYTKLLRKSRTL